MSDLQLIANRENAQHSTGPRTPEGKKRSSLNATRHGLTGQVVVMPYEDLEAYNAFVERYIQGLTPKNEPEKQLALDMANTVWKLNRASSIESGIYAMGHHDNADRNHVLGKLQATRKPQPPGKSPAPRPAPIDQALSGHAGPPPRTKKGRNGPSAPNR